MNFIYKPSTRISPWDGTLPMKSGYYKVLAEYNDHSGTKQTKTTVFYYFEGFKEWAPMFPGDKNCRPIVWWDWGPERKDADKVIAAVEKELGRGTSLGEISLKTDVSDDGRIWCGVYKRNETGQIDLVQPEVLVDKTYLEWMFDGLKEVD